MTKKFAFLIVAAMGLAEPACAQSVRVITGDIEHIYGPGGQLLDDDALRARNERAERDIQVKRIERDMALRQEEAEAEMRGREHLLTKPMLVAATNRCKAPDQPDHCWAARRVLAIFRQRPEHNFA
jgi:hypothetical protein